MKNWRRLAVLATAAAVAASALGPTARAQAPDETGTDDAPPSTEPAGDPFGVDFDELAPDGETVHSWAVTPAGSLDSSESGNRSNLSYQGDPGDVIEDGIILYNLGNEQLTFQVYATDAYNNADGQVDLLPGDEAPSDVGSWVEMIQDNVTVPPGQQVMLPFTLTIPETAEPGDHTGAIVAASTVFGRSDSGQVVTVDRRTGTTLLLRVNGPLRADLAVEGLSVDYSPSANPLGGTATVRYRVENRGNIRLGGTAHASVAGPLGIGRKRAADLELPELLPGEGFDVETTIDGAAGLVLAKGSVELEPSAAADGFQLQNASRSSSTFAPPVTLLAGALLLILGLLARRAFRRHRTAELGPPVVVPDDVIDPSHDREHQPT